MLPMRNTYAWRIAIECLRGLVFCAASLVLFLLLICILVIVQGQQDEVRPASVAIVLGAAQWNGVPSPVLEARLDHAYDLYRRGYVSRILLTGGTGPGDTISEAAAGKRYLIERGVPAEALLLEEQGRTTTESLQNATAIARANAMTTALIVSDPFHMLRALKITRDLGIIAYGSPTRTSPISQNTEEELRYVVRESWAYLVYTLTRF